MDCEIMELLANFEQTTIIRHGKHYTAVYRNLGTNLKDWISQLRGNWRYIHSTMMVIKLPRSTCAECADLLSLAPEALPATHSHLA